MPQETVSAPRPNKNKPKISKRKKKPLYKSQRKNKVVFPTTPKSMDMVWKQSSTPAYRLTKTQAEFNFILNLMLSLVHPNWNTQNSFICWYQ